MAEQQNRQQRRAAEREERRGRASAADNQAVTPDQALALAEQAKGPYKSCVSDLQIDEWDEPEPREYAARWTISAFTAINLGDTNAPFTDALTLTVIASSEREAEVIALLTAEVTRIELASFPASLDPPKRDEPPIEAEPVDLGKKLKAVRPDRAMGAQFVQALQRGRVI